MIDVAQLKKKRHNRTPSTKVVLAETRSKMRTVNDQRYIPQNMVIYNNTRKRIKIKENAPIRKTILVI